MSACIFTAYEKQNPIARACRAKGTTSRANAWKNSSRSISASAPGIACRARSSITGVPDASKLTTAARKFVPPASSAMTRSPRGTSRAVST